MRFVSEFAPPERVPEEQPTAFPRVVSARCSVVSNRPGSVRSLTWLHRVIHSYHVPGGRAVWISRLERRESACRSTSHRQSWMPFSRSARSMSFSVMPPASWVVSRTSTSPSGWSSPGDATRPRRGRPRRSKPRRVQIVVELEDADDFVAVAVPFLGSGADFASESRSAIRIRRSAWQKVRRGQSSESLVSIASGSRRACRQGVLDRHALVPRAG